jgi:hypothetical protein
MIRKSSSIALKAVLGILFASFITIGCNSSGEDKKETPADSTTAPVAAPATDTSAQKMDTAATKPVVTPN